MNPKIRKLIIAALAVLTLAGVVFTTTIKPVSDQSATGNPASQETVLGQMDSEGNADWDDAKDGLTQDESDDRADGTDDEADAIEEDSDGKSGKGTNSDSGVAGVAASSSAAEQTGSEEKDENSSSKQETISCTITIDCSLLTDEAVLRSTGNENKQRYVPSNGKIASDKSVKIKKGSSVYDVLKSFCQAQNIRMEASYTPGLETYYVEGINHLYEFDGGEGSGWVYFVNGQSPNYGASDVKVQEGDSIVWMYTLDYGNDVTP